MELCPYYTRFHAGFSRLNENFVTDSGKTKSLTDKVNYLQSYLKTFKTTLTNKQYELATYELNKAKKYQTNKV
jgi:hypothetical protein